jgi:hypothetical protein
MLVSLRVNTGADDQALFGHPKCCNSLCATMSGIAQLEAVSPFMQEGCGTMTLVLGQLRLLRQDVAEDLPLRL